MEIYYYGMKVFLFASLLSSLVKFEPLQKHTLALSILYTALVALLSYVFLLSQHRQPDYELWQYWLGMNFLLTWAYFGLLARFSDSKLLWLILPFCLVVLFNEPNLVPYWMRLVRR
jgi:hypothetical protein